jgi:Flp pilus assembly protein TadD
VAQFLVHQGDPEGALKLLSRWGDRKDSDALVTSALAYTRMGRSNEAAQALHDAWRRDPYDPRLAGAIKTVEGEPPLSSSAD